MADDKPAAAPKETKPAAKETDFAAMLAEIKAWARRELHLHANGASHEEREKLNP